MRPQIRRPIRYTCHVVIPARKRRAFDAWRIRVAGRVARKSSREKYVRVKILRSIKSVMEQQARRRHPIAASARSTDPRKVNKRIQQIQRVTESAHAHTEPADANPT